MAYVDLPPSPRRESHFSLSDYVDNASIESILSGAGYQTEKKIVSVNAGGKYVDLIQVRNSDQIRFYVYINVTRFIYSCGSANDQVTTECELEPSAELEKLHNSLSPDNLGVLCETRDGITMICRDSKLNKKVKSYKFYGSSDHCYYPIIYFTDIEGNNAIVGKKVSMAYTLIDECNHERHNIRLTESKEKAETFIRSYLAAIDSVRSIDHLNRSSIKKLEGYALTYQAQAATGTLSSCNAKKFHATLEALKELRSRTVALDSAMENLERLATNLAPMAVQIRDISPIIDCCSKAPHVSY